LIVAFYFTLQFVGSKIMIYIILYFCLVVAHCSGKDHFKIQIPIMIKNLSAPLSHPPLLSVFLSTGKLWYSSSPQNTFTCMSNSGPAKFFVNMSASLSLDLIHLITISPCSVSLRKKYCPTSTCLVCPSVLQLLAQSIAPLLSISMIIGFST